MTISSIFFDAFIIVRQGKDLGVGSERADLTEQNFHAADGWDIREVLPGVFSLHREGMDSPMTVGGYGYSYSSAPTPDLEAAESGDGDESGARGQVPQASPKRKGKR